MVRNQFNGRLQILYYKFCGYVSSWCYDKNSMVTTIMSPFNPRFQYIVLLKITFNVFRFRNPFLSWNRESALHLVWATGTCSQKKNKKKTCSQTFQRTDLLMGYLQNNECQPHRTCVKKDKPVFHYLIIMFTLMFGCITTYNKPFFCPVNLHSVCILNNILINNVSIC